MWIIYLLSFYIGLLEMCWFKSLTMLYGCSADVEEFYQQCDPGKGLRFSPSLSCHFFFLLRVWVNALYVVLTLLFFWTTYMWASLLRQVGYMLSIVVVIGLSASMIVICLHCLSSIFVRCVICDHATYSFYK